MRQIDTETDSGSDDSQNALFSLESDRYKRLTATLFINDTRINFTLDTGSRVNVLPIALIRKTGL